MRLPLARHRGSSRSRSPSPQAVLAQGDDPHGGGEIAARISRHGAGLRRRVVRLRGERAFRPPLPSNGNRRPCLAALRPHHPVDSRFPPLLPAFLGVRVRPMAWPSPVRRFEGSRNDDAGQPGKLAQSGGRGHGPAVRGAGRPPAPLCPIEDHGRMEHEPLDDDSEDEGGEDS